MMNMAGNALQDLLTLMCRPAVPSWNHNRTDTD